MARVLVVDDAAFMRKMVSDALTKGGHEVVGEAGNGVEAVARYQELQPELTTLDITMPEKDGLSALKEIIALDPAARVIMCSALGQETQGARVDQGSAPRTSSSSRSRPSACSTPSARRSRSAPAAPSPRPVDSPFRRPVDERPRAANGPA